MNLKRILFYLVALTLVALIIACSMPSLNRARESAKRSSGYNSYAQLQEQQLGGEMPASGQELWIIPTDETTKKTQQSSDDLNAALPATRHGQENMRQNIDSAEHELNEIRPDRPQPFETPTSPLLAARLANQQLIPVPLKHTDVSATLSGYIASVHVTQQFTNPYAEKIEAVYVFPLPENAGVNEFVMTIGDRHIRGIVRERAEAEKIYAEAKSQGYVASLMTQERPNIFTQNVANIEPGKQIDIDIQYFHTLAYHDGFFEWVFPMVVGPRYNPASMLAPDGTGTGIGAVARNAPNTSGQKTEIQYLAPTERSGHDISLHVQLDAGVPIEQLTSLNHKIIESDTALRTKTARAIQLDPADNIPNKDFVLRYKVAGNKVKTALFIQKNKEGTGGGGGWLTLMLVPPESLKSIPRRGVEMVFVVDTSGSMSGQPIAQAKAAVRTALTKMDPDDTFQVVNFDSTTGQMSPQPMPVNAFTLARAQTYVAQMQGGGGTEMLKGMNAALDFPHDPHRTRVVAFLTDGYIGNEIDVLRGLHDQLLDSRVFSFGVGSSSNRYLLDAMARLGHGTAAYLSLNEPAEPVMTQYFDHISHPALANVHVDFGGLQVSDIFPTRIPELFVGQPIFITGRFTGSIPQHAAITLTGTVGGDLDHPLSFSLPASDSIEENPAIATIWARSKLTDLADQSIYDLRDTSDQIKQTALTYGLISSSTSFIAVDSTQKTAGDHGTTVAVPVPMPEGVRYETTVQERQ